MWQRYNQTSHIFEKSVDNGASWTPLPLSGAIITEGMIPIGQLPPNVAYNHINNNFQTAQTFDGNQRILSVTDSPRVSFIDNAQPIDQRIFQILNNGGFLSIWCLNDAESIVQATPLVMNRGGDVSIGRDITGVRTVYASNAYVELGRSIAMGYWIDLAPVMAASAGTITVNANYGCKYMLVGKTMTIAFYFGVTLSAAPGNLTLALPSGYLCTGGFSATSLLIGNQAQGMCQAPTGAAVLNLYRDISGGGTFTAGENLLGATISFQVT